ncbi:hypothetical protein GY45DRAFT_1290045 [Cubamyces sp. BRFM 1775]|nr:hypothetical protein GY45DRAFT_1290045 [Cubamyces sp. BRFM 1775]
MVTTDSGSHQNMDAGRDAQLRAAITRIRPSEVFLPEHLRLGAGQWPEFQLAMKTIFELNDLPLAHLENVACPRLLLTADEERRRGGRWSTDDDLCKAIIVLNVRGDHVRFSELEIDKCTAAELWELLKRRNAEIRGQVLEKWRWLVRVYAGLLGAAWIVILLIMLQLLAYA